MTSQSFKIGAFLQTTLADIIDTYPIVAEKGSSAPFCVFRRIGYAERDTKDAFNYDERVSVEVTVCAKTYTKSVDLAEQVKETLEHKRGKFGECLISNVTMTNANEDWIADAYVQRLTFTITIDALPKI